MFFTLQIVNLIKETLPPFLHPSVNFLWCEIRWKCPSFWWYPYAFNIFSKENKNQGGYKRTTYLMSSSALFCGGEYVGSFVILLVRYIPFCVKWCVLYQPLMYHTGPCNNFFKVVNPRGLKLISINNLIFIW